MAFVHGLLGLSLENTRLRGLNMRIFFPHSSERWESVKVTAGLISSQVSSHGCVSQDHLSTCVSVSKSFLI